MSLWSKKDSGSRSEPPHNIWNFAYASLTAGATGCALIPTLGWYAVAAGVAVLGAVSWATWIILWHAHAIRKRPSIADGPWS